MSILDVVRTIMPSWSPVNILGKAIWGEKQQEEKPAPPSVFHSALVSPDFFFWGSVLAASGVGYLIYKKKYGRRGRRR